MDYTKQTLLFKIKKTLRYIRLYGLNRTLIKIKGQYHMKREFTRLPVLQDIPKKGKHVGIIGCGNYAFSNIAYYLKKNFGDIVRGAMDININRAASLYKEYGLHYYTNDPDRIINDSSIDLIYIASNHASHAEYAIKALKKGKSVHIEKPHVVTEDQLLRLCAAFEESKEKIGLGFNRPDSVIGKKIKEHLASQSGASMLNWFIAGHEISPDHWYFKDEEGGRVLGNLCHWTDFVYNMVAPENRYPIKIKPTSAEKSDCDIAVTYTFGDGSISAITFSAKGHTFEGVRERFSAHRGNVLISMDDFKNLMVEVLDKKYKTRLFYRDHGHENRICNSYRLSQSSDNNCSGCSTKYVWETGQLFLKTKEALEKDHEITLQPFTKL